MDLGRTAHQREFAAEFEAEHVGRRIHETQRAVKVERVAGVIGLETLGRDDLENIARVDVFLRVADHVADIPRAWCCYPGRWAAGWQ